MYHVLFSAIEKEVDIGINHFSFHVKAGQPFGGIHSISSGSTEVDILHFQSNDGMRYGYWLSPGFRYYCQYNSETELYEVLEDPDESRYCSKFRELQQKQLLVQYPKVDENDTWTELTRYINWRTVSRVYNLPNKQHKAFMDSSMSTVEEAERLKDRLPDSKFPVLEYTRINFKSREAIRSDHVMHDFHNRSYYLFEVILPRMFQGSIYHYFSELQVSYLNTVLFANYGSSMQWHNLVELLLTSESFNQYSLLDELLLAEFQNFPEEYISTLINAECWTRLIAHHHHHHTNLPQLANYFKQNPLLPFQPPSDDNDDEEIDPYQSGDSIGMNATSEDDDGPAIISGVYHQPL